MKERKYSSNVTINKKSWPETGNISDYYTDAPSHFPVNQRRRVLHKFPGSTPERRSVAPTVRRASALKCLWFLHLKAINYVCVFFRCQQDKSINYEILVNLFSLVAFYLTSHAFSCSSIYNNSANKKKKWKMTRLSRCSRNRYKSHSAIVGLNVLEVGHITSRKGARF